MNRRIANFFELEMYFNQNDNIHSGNTKKFLNEPFYRQILNVIK
jgi:hypothetical protein